MSSASVLSFSTFFKYFIFNPKSSHLAKSEQDIARVSRRFLSILTLGQLPKICERSYSKKAKRLLSKSYHKMISQIKDPWKSANILEETLRKNRAVPCHQIINGLFLGNNMAFAQVTGFNVRLYKEDGLNYTNLDTSNPKAFKSVITLCPIQIVKGDFIDLADYSTPFIRDFVRKREVSWIYIGKTLDDGLDGWSTLVHDCTKPKSSLANREIYSGIPHQELINIVDQKKKAIDSIPVKQWFEPIFKKLDQAVFENKRVLVHCQMGQSRSASLLAAYLINRFQLNEEQAIAYLRSKRLCVNPHPEFIQQLKQYAKRLHQQVN